MAKQVRVCRVCGQVNPDDDRTRCNKCWASLAGASTVTQVEGERHTRRLELTFLRNRVFRIVFLLAAAVGFTVWGVLVFFELGANPPSPTTSLNASVSPQTWAQARRTPQNTGYTPNPAPIPQRTQWTYSSSEPVVASPTVVDNRIYFTTDNGDAVALDLDTGQQVWRYTSELPSSSTPAVVDDMVIFSVRPSRVIALDKETGALRWQSENFRTSFLASPIVVDGTVYIGGEDNKIYALDAATGQKRWDFATKEWIIAPVAYADDTLAVTSMDGVIHILDTTTGRKRFVFDSSSPITGSPVIHGDQVYFGTHRGIVWALDRRAITYPFERAMWRWKVQLYVWDMIIDEAPLQKGTVWGTHIGGKVINSPAIAHDNVYVANDEGKVTALDAATGLAQWSTVLDENITTAPVVAGWTVLVGTENGVVYGMDAHTGEMVWDFSADGSIADSPIIAGDSMYLVTDAGTIYAVTGEGT